jgi:hypothetical protein
VLSRALYANHGVPSGIPCGKHAERMRFLCGALSSRHVPGDSSHSGPPYGACSSSLISLRRRLLYFWKTSYLRSMYAKKAYRSLDKVLAK